MCPSIPGNFHNPYASTISAAEAVPKSHYFLHFPKLWSQAGPSLPLCFTALFSQLPAVCICPFVVHLKLISLPCLNSMSYTCPWSQLQMLAYLSESSRVILPLGHCTEVILPFFFLERSNFFLASGSFGFAQHRLFCSLLSLQVDSCFFFIFTFRLRSSSLHGLSWLQYLCIICFSLFASISWFCFFTALILELNWNFCLFIGLSSRWQVLWDRSCDWSRSPEAKLCLALYCTAQALKIQNDVVHLTIKYQIFFNEYMYIHPFYR